MQSFSVLQFGERCANITNTAKLGATSLDGALESIDRALELCKQQMASLEGRNKSHLASYQRVKERMAQLSQSD